MILARAVSTLGGNCCKASRSSMLRNSCRLGRVRCSSTRHPAGFVPPTQGDLIELRDRVQEFSKRDIPDAVAVETDSLNNFPQDMWQKLGDAGLLGITVEEEFGGLAMGYQAHCIVMEELSRASASIALSYAAHSQLCVNQIRRHATENQKARFLPGLVCGRKVGALAMSEHGAGSDVIGMSTTASPVDGGFRINGNKMWITNGPEADFVVLYAKTDPKAGSKGVSAFVVETKDESGRPVDGFSVARKLDKLGMRGSNTGELVFENVFVPASNLLGTINSGVQILMSGLDLERLVLSAGPLGIMRACMDIALPYAATRRQFQQPIANFQLIQAKLADMYSRYASSASLTYTIAAAVDNGSPAHFLVPYSLFPHAQTHAPAGSRDAVATSHDCAAAILLAAENATHVALDTIQCLGGTGYVNEVAAGRQLRDAKLYEIGAGTSEVRRLVIGRALGSMFATRSN